MSLLLFVRLGHRDLTSSHEARAAQNAQRMLDTGEWGLPVLFDGQADLQKPPGFYWLVAAIGWLQGGRIDAWAARLPAAVAGAVCVWAVFAFLRREGRPVAAMVAAASLATAVHFTAIARTARIDVPLTCAAAVALLAFYRGVRKPLPPTPSPKWGGGVRPANSPFPPREGGRGVRWFLLSAVAAAAGVMLKGPIALALIGPTAVAWLLVRPKPTPGNGWALSPAMALLGTLIVAGLSLPWFLWANHTTQGEFARVFFWHHNVDRFAGTSTTLASHPWWYYVPRFAADFLPWSPALAFLAVWVVARRAPDPILRFAIVWFGVMLLVLSTAQFKRSDYLLPLYPGAAIALGCAAETWLATRTNPRTARAAKWAFGLAITGSVIASQVMTFVVEPAAQAKDEKQAFAEMIRSHAPPPHEVMLFRAESHLLAFHLGRPLLTRVEWHDLNDWLAEPGPHFVVMPPEYAYSAQQIVRSRKLVLVARLEDYTPDKPARPLVLLRTE